LFLLSCAVDCLIFQHVLVFLPGVLVSIGVQDRHNDKLELVDQASDLLVVAISSNELFGNIGNNGRSNPFYSSW
jgi:hypothetical protein